MTVSGNVFAALIAELERRLQTKELSQRLIFPSFSLRAGLNELLFNAQTIQVVTGLDPTQAQRQALLNLEDFSVLVNQIPQIGSGFSPDGGMIWSVYECMINSAQLAITDPDKEPPNSSVALAFRRAREEFDLAILTSLKPDSAGYWPTIALPPDDVSDGDAWTRIKLDQGNIDQLSTEASQEAKEWLMERGLLEDIQGSGILVKSLSIELFPLTFRRAWFDPSLFHSRAWRWNDEPLSDGGDPPRGLLTAYIIKVILARKLEIELDLEPAKAQAVLPGAISSQPPVGTNSSVFTATFSGTSMRKLRIFSAASKQLKPMSFRSFTASASIDTKGHRSLNHIVPPDNSVLGFPVLPVFRSAQIIARISAEIDKIRSENRRLANRKTELQQEIDKLEKQIREINNLLKSLKPIKLTIFQSTPKLDDKSKKVSKLQQDLKLKQTQTAGVDKALQAQDEQLEDLAALLTHFESLTQTQIEDDVFILAYVCERLPKSPNPDPKLFGE